MVRSLKRLWAGGKSGRNPTDRSKQGTKRSLLTEAAGIPVGLAVEGANRHDMKLVRQTLESIPKSIEKKRRKAKSKAKAKAKARAEQGLCMDKGYDYDEVREIVQEFGFTAHIRARGEEAQALKREAGFKARRWVVERTHSWMNRFRRILIRWEKKGENYLALLHLTCACITLKAALLG